MSADELRRAAALLRERAEAATPGPWFLDGAGCSGIFTEARVSETSQDVAFVVNGWPDADATEAYIAAMHPGVGSLLADLLEHLATDYENAEVDGRTLDHALMPLARLILAGAS
jgi:hypothetical protein